MDPALWAQLRAEQTARVQASREAEAEKMARLTPVTDAEVEKYGTGRPDAEVSPERDAGEAALAEVRAEVERLGELVDRMPDPAAERRAEMDEAAVNEPVVHEPQAEPELESAWQPGDAQGYQEPTASADADVEMEIG